MPKFKLLISTLKQGDPVIIYDDTSKSPCGYLLLSATRSSEEKITFLINNGRGIVLCPIQEEHARSLGLSPLGNSSKESFPITIGIESRTGITTGISSADRSETIKSLTTWDTNPKAIIAPGHIFPLIGKKGGLLVKSGIAEASLDLLKIAEEKEIGTITHLLSREGELCSEREIHAFSESKKIPLVKISEIIQYRLRFEPLITKVAKARLPTEDYGEFTAHCYLSNHDQAEHLVLTKGLSEEPTSPTLVRMHSERKLGDLFLHTKEESRNKLNSALKKINEHGSGALVYIRKHKTHFISEQLRKITPEDTKDAASKMEKVTELRELGIGAQMLLDLHIRELKLLTSSQSNLIDLSVFNLEIKEQVSL